MFHVTLPFSSSLSSDAAHNAEHPSRNEACQEMKCLLVCNSTCPPVLLRKLVLEVQPEVELQAIPECFSSNLAPNCVLELDIHS